MSLFHIIGLAVAAACFIIGSVAWRMGYSAGHKAAVDEERNMALKLARTALPADNVIDLEIPRPGAR